MDDATKPARPQVQYKRKGYTPPPSPATVRRRAKAAENPEPKPEKAPKPAKPKKEPSPLDIYKKSDTSEIQGVNATAKALVEAMVWEGLNRLAAIEKVGISTSYAYRLLRSPDVMAHYRAELDVLRSSVQARTVHRMVELSEQDDNQTAAVAAGKLLLGLDAQKERAAGTTVNVAVLTPGWVIDCTAALSGRRQPAELPQIDGNPLKDITPVPAPSPNALAAPAGAPLPPASPAFGGGLEGTRPGSGAAPGDRHAWARPATRDGGGGPLDLAALRRGVGGKTEPSSSTS